MPSRGLRMQSLGQRSLQALREVRWGEVLVVSISAATLIVIIGLWLLGTELLLG